MKSSFRKRTDTLPSPRQAPPEDDQRLAGVLARSGAVDRAELDAALRAPGGTLARRLVDRGSLSDRELAQVLAQHYGKALHDFRTVAPDAEALATLPAQRATELEALPISVRDGVTEVAVVDPAPEHLEAVAAAVGGPVSVTVAARSDLVRALGSAYRATRDVSSRVQEFEAQDVLRAEASRLTASSASDDAPVVQVVQSIITQALRDRASDVHVEPFGERVRVRYRIDGALTEVLDLPGSIGPGLVSRIKILGDLNIVERRRPQDGQISMDVEGRDVDIRVATTPVVGGEKVVLRLLDKSRPLFQLEQLGMP